MTGLVRKTTLLGVCGLFVAGAAMANVPSLTMSDVPAYINVGGRSALGVLDPLTSFPVHVRDGLSANIAGSLVTLDFTLCTDTDLCTAVVAGQTVSCANKTVSGNTNSTGQITFNVLGGGYNTGTVIPPAIFAGAGASCVHVTADGTPLNNATAVVFDTNGNRAGGNGVNGFDLSVLKTDIGASNAGAPYKGRSDYSQDGAVNGFDVSFFKAVLGGGSAGGCATSGGIAAPYCVPNH